MTPALKIPLHPAASTLIDVERSARDTLRDGISHGDSARQITIYAAVLEGPRCQRSLSRRVASISVIEAACWHPVHTFGHLRSDAHHRAIRLSPVDPAAHFSLTGIAHVYMILGDFDAALTWATRSLAINANFLPTYWMLIAANAQLGRMAEAHRHLDEFRKIAPGATIAGIRSGQPQGDPSRLAAIIAGLRLAGLVEG